MSPKEVADLSLNDLLSELGFWVTQAEYADKMAGHAMKLFDDAQVVQGEMFQLLKDVHAIATHPVNFQSALDRVAGLIEGFFGI